MASDTKPTQPADASELSFEQAIGELESIISNVEEGKIGIERALSQYERGVKLVARCRDILNTVEQKIQTLESADLPGGQAGETNAAGTAGS